MLDGILSAAAAAIIAVISASGYLGVAALMALESACLPIPSEVVMPFAGYLASTGRFNLLLVATAGAAGCNIGSSAAYYVGAHGGRPLVQRWGRYLLLNPDSLDSAERFFLRYGAAAVFIGRLLPVVRTFIALPAGVGRMRQWPFQLYTFTGSWLWCGALAWAGQVLGARWDSDPRLRGFMHRFDFAVVALLAAGFAYFIWTHLHHRRPGNPP